MVANAVFVFLQQKISENGIFAIFIWKIVFFAIFIKKNYSISAKNFLGLGRAVNELSRAEFYRVRVEFFPTESNQTW